LIKRLHIILQYQTQINPHFTTNMINHPSSLLLTAPLSSTKFLITADSSASSSSSESGVRIAAAGRFSRDTEEIRCSGNPHRGNRAFHYQQTHSQSKIGPTTVQFIEHDVENEVLPSSPFLRNVLPSPTGVTTLFARHEIITSAEPLGVGGFSLVFGVVGFCFDPVISHKLSKRQNQQRLGYQQLCLESNREWQARSPLLRRTKYAFALKHLKPQLLSEWCHGITTRDHPVFKGKDEKRRRFLYAASDLVVESMYLERLSEHPSIITLRGLPFEGYRAFRHGTADGFFLLMDCMDEGTLEDLIHHPTPSDVRLTFEEHIRHLTDLAGALEHLHSHNIVFRDLKPQNIGFTTCRVSQVKKIQLFDFGLARELPDGTQDETFEMSGVGTRRYQAPEIVLNGRYNSKIDVYSLALVMWEMITKQRPYPTYDESAHALYVCQRGERPKIQLPTNCSCSEWQDLFDRMWCASIQQRLSMTQVVLVLKDIAENGRVKETSSQVSLQNTTQPLSPMFRSLKCMPDSPTSVALTTAIEHWPRPQMLMGMTSDSKPSAVETDAIGRKASPGGFKTASLLLNAMSPPRTSPALPLPPMPLAPKLRLGMPFQSDNMLPSDAIRGTCSGRSSILSASISLDSDQIECFGNNQQPKDPTAEMVGDNESIDSESVRQMTMDDGSGSTGSDGAASICFLSESLGSMGVTVKSGEIASVFRCNGQSFSWGRRSVASLMAQVTFDALQDDKYDSLLGIEVVCDQPGFS
jgi:serine/threonine protein kinase